MIKLVKNLPLAALEINIFHCVYCIHQSSDTVYTGISHSREIYPLQSKVNRLIRLFVFRLVICSYLQL